jgi:hypothetical protein
MPTRTWALSALLAMTIAGAGAASAPAAGCDPIDPAACMLPFPNDFFTTADASTATGRRVDFSVTGMPRNVAGKPIDPTDWNRADGFSPGSMIVTRVPGLDGAKAFAETDPVTLTDIGRYRAKDAPVVVIDAATGRRWPIFTELDESIGSGAAADAARTLLIRPAKNFREGHRYIVALRAMKDATGRLLAPSAAFRAYRDGTATDARAAHFDKLFRKLARAGIRRGSLYLAWDFTVASWQSLAARMLHIRNDAFQQLGDDNLADLKVTGAAPTFTLNRVEDATCGPRAQLPPGVDKLGDVPGVDLDCNRDGDPRVARDIKGTMVVPCYLDVPGCQPVHSQFLLDPRDGLPAQIPGNAMKVDFECLVPKRALADGAGKARPSLYGHGLFGGYGEIHQDQIKGMEDEHNFIHCATAWAGMASEDVPNVATILADLSSFPTLADRVQQGMLNFLYLGRLMIHPAGLGASAAFQTADGRSLIDNRRLFYDGNSQGGIIGGALTAVAPDFNRATLGVLGMNYSTLLTRSTDFGTGTHDPSPTPDDPTNGLEYAYPLYKAYPQLNERQLIFALMQMLWDRAEPNGYAQHMTTHPYPDTPKHQVLLMAGYGDHQVSNYAAEVEARTIGARVLKADMLRPGRAWERKPWYGLKPVDPAHTADVSVFTVWDGGSRPSPLSNVAQDNTYDDDPHEWVRRTPAARAMKSGFLSLDSRIVDTCGSYCDTYNYPFNPVLAKLSPLGP